MTDCCVSHRVFERLDRDRNLDYQPLQNLLAAARWQEADEQTRRLMLQTMGLSANQYLSEAEFREFPDTVLRTLDRLWRQFSSDRFGFSRQNQIWRQIGGWEPDANYDTWLHFGTQVGWRQGYWLSPSDLAFGLHAPEGHLPATWTAEFELGEIAVSLFEKIDSAIAQRLVKIRD